MPGLRYESEVFKSLFTVVILKVEEFPVIKI